MNILLTGKNGQVGFELQRALAPLGVVHAVDSRDCDLADAQALRELIRKVHPQVIVNAAAYTAVDRAEQEPGAAMAINAVAPGVMGEEAARLGATVIHYSTDYVFDGQKDSPYRETDTCSPLSVYGHSKRDGEAALVRSTPQHLIFRTCWVVGAHGQNFAKTMLRLAQERDELRVVNDQWGSPTSAALIADVTAHVVRQLQQTRGHDFPFGLYHLSAAGETTWYAYARFVLDQAAQRGRTHRIAGDRIEAISSEQYPTLAKRPSNSRLDTAHLRQTFGLTLPHWQQGLHHILDQIL